jgi:hypothetical protein
VEEALVAHLVDQQAYQMELLELQTQVVEVVGL